MLLNSVKGRGKYSPPGATAAVVAEEEDEEEAAEAEEVGEGEDADAPTTPLKRQDGDYHFREQDAICACSISRASEALERRLSAAP